jgi:hypothetical protein
MTKILAVPEFVEFFSTKPTPLRGFGEKSLSPPHQSKTNTWSFILFFNLRNPIYKSIFEKQPQELNKIIQTKIEIRHQQCDIFFDFEHTTAFKLHSFN